MQYALNPLPPEITRIILQENPQVYNRLVRSSSSLRNLGYQENITRRICETPISLTEIKDWIREDPIRLNLSSLELPPDDSKDIFNTVYFQYNKDTKQFKVLHYGLTLHGRHFEGTAIRLDKELKFLDYYYTPGTYITNIFVYFQLIWCRVRCRPYAIPLTIQLFNKINDNYHYIYLKYKLPYFLDQWKGYLEDLSINVTDKNLTYDPNTIEGIQDLAKQIEAELPEALTTYSQSL